MSSKGKQLQLLDVDIKSVLVEVIEAEELTPDEERERLYLERKVERAFYEAGKALQSLRDRRLYRSTHKTFEEYCRDRFGHSRQKSNYLIAAAGVYDNLTTNGCQNLPIDNLTTNGCQNLPIDGLTTNSSQIPPIDNLTTNGCQNLPTSKTSDLTTNSGQILPTSERQVRPLTALEPDEQREVWQQAVETAGGKVPSGRIVKDIVQHIMERTKVPNPFRVGEVCQIIPKDNPELRGKGGYWCIVSAVHDFSCTVTTWDGEYTIALQHLKSKNYSDAECEEMKRVYLRISRLYSPEMESAACEVLKSLGELKQPYLTALEEKLLGVLEEEYGGLQKD